MPRQVKSMPLAFEASQKLDLPVRTGAERLPTYLLEEERVLWGAAGRQTAHPPAVQGATAMW